MKFYSFLNFNGFTMEVWEWKSNFIQHFIMNLNNLSMLGSKLNHISKRDPWYQGDQIIFYQLKSYINYVTVLNSCVVFP